MIMLNKKISLSSTSEKWLSVQIPEIKASGEDV